MKKIALIIIAVFLNLMLISCTENDELIKKDANSTIKSELQTESENCCSGDGELPPPPPPKKD
ncbi:conserved exported protein of unknown function [Tenacibaculum sp. 190130A14a]|uniref:Lipoprotein n=1 Tax=Tenacibaculum polynesiense TaxID=3137857 RepID=A0ABP1F0W4_9FLAO